MILAIVIYFVIGLGIATVVEVLHAETPIDWLWVVIATVGWLPLGLLTLYQEIRHK